MTFFFFDGGELTRSLSRELLKKAKGNAALISPSCGIATTSPWNSSELKAWNSIRHWKEPCRHNHGMEFLNRSECWISGFLWVGLGMLIARETRVSTRRDLD
ncbi:hypothetical protein HN51_011563 [Arachis hypogaea]